MSLRSRKIRILLLLLAGATTLGFAFRSTRSSWAEVATFEDVGGCIEFAPDSRSFVACTGKYHRELGEWEVSTRRRTLTHRSDAWIKRYDRDGLLAITRSKGTIEIWNETSGKCLATFDSQFDKKAGGIAAIEVNPDRSTLIIAYEYGMLRIIPFQAQDTARTIETDHLYVDCMALSHDGELLAIGGRMKSGKRGIRLFELPDGRLRTTVQMRRDPNCLSFSADNRVLAAGYGGLRYTFLGGILHPVGSPDSCFGRVLLCDAKTGQKLVTLGDQQHWVNCIAFSPDGRMLASGGSGGPAPEPHLVMVWNTSTSKKIATMSGHIGDIQAVRFSPDGELLATQDGDRTKFWKVPSTE